MSRGSPEIETLYASARERRGAPPLLFVHGGFHGAWCWSTFFMPWFSNRGFDCFAVSYRDHGGAERTGRHREWRLRDYVDDVRRAADDLSEKPLLVGHSLGGSIVQKLAAEGGYPGMVLLAPSPVGGANRTIFRLIGSFPGPMLRALMTGDLMAALPAFSTFLLSEGLPDKERAEVISRCTGLTSLRAANDAFYFDPPRPRRLGIPVLVCSGEKDWSIPSRKNKRLARAYRGDHIFVPTAHDVMCDLGWEQAAEFIYEWVTREVEIVTSQPL